MYSWTFVPLSGRRDLELESINVTRSGPQTCHCAVDHLGNTPGC